MRVLFLAHMWVPYHCAGAEVTAQALMAALVKRGHRVTVVLSRPHPDMTGPYEVDGVQIHPHINKGDPLRYIPETDLIVSHLENADRADILGRLYSVPVCQVLHNNYAQTKRQIGFPSICVANTNWVLEDFRQAWPQLRGERRPPRWVVAHPHVDIERYRTTPGDRVTLVNLWEHKGSATFYKLAAMFPRRKFLGVKGAYGVQDVRDLPNVEILDHLPDHRMAEQVYSRTRVLLVPSAYESYGRVAIEAACSGIPVIAHPTPGLRESLGEAGLFADRDDVEEWAEHLRALSVTQQYAAASKRIKARAQEMYETSTSELDTWVTAAEGVARGPAGFAR